MPEHILEGLESSPAGRTREAGLGSGGPWDPGGRPTPGGHMGKQVLRIHVASFSFALYQYSRIHQKAFTPGTGEEDIYIKC